MLCEGMSMRAASRMADCSINTVTKLLVEVGDACAKYQFETLKDLPCQRLQLDEIWAFVGAKERNATPEQKAEGFGDVWLWTAICADTKLIPTWYVGDRDQRSGVEFAIDLAKRLRSRRPQITSDGLGVYRPAIDQAFGSDVDFAQLVKQYEVPYEAQRRYSPPVCVGATKTVVKGEPDARHISTSYVERSNLTLRMGCRRYTRLTNAFSKKVENHARAVALHMMFYNFGRIHKSLRITPAMAAGVSDHVWTLEEIAALAA
jgi:IS1 family transposase